MRHKEPRMYAFTPKCSYPLRTALTTIGDVNTLDIMYLIIAFKTHNWDEIANDVNSRDC